MSREQLFENSDFLPLVGQRYIATDNARAMAALAGDSYPVPQGVIYVTIKRVYPEHRKVQVRPDGMWLTYDALAAHFRPVEPGKAAA